MGGGGGGGTIPLQASVKRRGRSPKGGGFVGVLGALLESCCRRLAHTQGSPRSGGGRQGTQPRWRLRRVGQGSVGYTSPPAPPQPCTWQPPTSRFSSLAVPRPPSLRPPHRKLFLINENGKLGPHIASRDVLGSRSNRSRSGSTTPGSERPGLGRVLLFPTLASRCAKGTQAPGDPSGRCAGSSPPAPSLPTLGS